MLDKSKSYRGVYAFLLLAAASLAMLPLLPPISQDQTYHDFPDQRVIFRKQHFWNVVSNVPFIASEQRAFAAFIAILRSLCSSSG